MKLVVRNHRPLKRWTGVDPMLPAAIAYERQAYILAQRGERVNELPRELWWRQ